MTDARAGSYVAPNRDPFGNSADVGRANAEAVLRAILAKGPMARATISQHVGLTKATVSRVTGRLMDIGLLQEGDPIRAALGRPTVPLEICGENRVVAMLHFGSTEMRIGLVDPRGIIRVERRLPYEDTDAEVAVDAAVRQLERVVRDDAAGSNVLGVGASIGGWVDPDSGRLLRFSPLGWYDVPFADMLARRLPWPLRFDHTIRGVALAERMYGVARDVEDFVELWVGDVLGAAVVDNGVIRRGPQGGAGVAAHLPLRHGPPRICGCGKERCLQAVASDGASVDIARERGILRPGQGMVDLVQLARAGEEGAAEVVAQTARYLASGFAGAVDLLNPTLVVAAGLITEAPQFLPAFRSVLATETDRFLDGESRVALSGFGDAAPTIASASLVLDAFYRDPFAFEVPASA